MPKPEAQVPSVFDRFFVRVRDEFYGPRPALLSTEAGQLFGDNRRVEARAKIAEAEAADHHIDAFEDAARTFIDTLVRSGVPLPPVEFYDQMISPTRPISELTAQNLADNLPSQVLQAALELQRVREGAAAVRTDEPTDVAKLPEVLVNSALSLVRSPHHKTRRITESNFAVLQTLAAAGPDGFVKPETLTEIGPKFNLKPESFARRAIYDLRKVLGKDPNSHELITTNRDRSTGESSYTARFTVKEAKLRTPVTALKPAAKVSDPAKQPVERAAQVRKVALVDREQEILDVVLKAQAKGGATRENLLEISGVTPQNLAWVKSRLSEKLTDSGQGRIINIGSSSEPRYVQASASTQSAPGYTPAVTEVASPADLGGQPSLEEVVTPSAPRLTAEDLERSPELVELSDQEVRFLTMRLVQHPNFSAIGNETDLETVKSAAGGEALGDVRAAELADDLAVKLTYYLNNSDALDRLPSDQAAIVTMAAVLEGDYGNLLKE